MSIKKIALLILVIGLVMGGVAFLSGGVRSVEWIDGRPVAVSAEESGKMEFVDETFDSFTNIEVNLDTMDSITLKEGDNFSVSGQNYENYGGLKAELQGNKLIVGTRKNVSLQMMNFNFLSVTSPQKSEVVITYPQGTVLDSVVVDSSLTTVAIDGLNAKNIKLSLDTADATVTGITADSLLTDISLGNLVVANLNVKDLTLDLDTGDLDANDVNAQKTSLEISLGDASFTNVDLGALDANVDTGSFIGDTFKAKDAKIEISLGDILLTNAIIEGVSELDADTGAVKIDFAMNEADLNLDLDTDLGDINVNGNEAKAGSNVGNTGASNNLQIEVSLGDIDLNFK